MIKRMLLAFTLVMFSSCYVHAQGNDKSSSSKVNKDKRANKKESKQKDDDVTYLDMSTPDKGDDDGMPAITPKGKL